MCVCVWVSTPIRTRILGGKEHVLNLGLGVCGMFALHNMYKNFHQNKFLLGHEQSIISGKQREIEKGTVDTSHKTYAHTVKLYLVVWYLFSFLWLLNMFIKRKHDHTKWCFVDKHFNFGSQSIRHTSRCVHDGAYLYKANVVQHKMLDQSDKES